MDYKVFSQPIRQDGFNLIELVIGIVVFSIALVIILSLIVPQARRSVDPIYQVRATELAQSLLNEITAKAFDENSNLSGGTLRCSESGAPNCTAHDALGNEAEAREQFDDVDDYHNLTVIANSQNADLTTLYTGFSLSVKVFYDNNLDGVDDGAIGHTKMIRVTVITPNGDNIVFASTRSNY